MQGIVLKWCTSPSSENNKYTSNSLPGKPTIFSTKRIEKKTLQAKLIYEYCICYSSHVFIVIYSTFDIFLNLKRKLLFGTYAMFKAFFVSLNDKLINIS